MNKTDIEELIVNTPILRGIEDPKCAAQQIISHLEYRQYKENELIITQGEMEGETFFILSGSVSIRVNGHKVATRKTGDTVGEMGAIDPLKERSADVIADKQLKVGVISAKKLSSVAKDNQGIWRNLAKIISDRLRERGDMHRAPNPDPQIFIGSSTQTLDIAKQLKAELNASLGPNCKVECWNDDIFKLSNTIIEVLELKSATCDFAILVAGADDIKTSIKTTSLVPRDNVIFEAGLFMGALSRERTFILTPDSTSKDQVELPSDLQGINLANFTKNEGSYDMSSAVDKISSIITDKGPKTRFKEPL